MATRRSDASMDLEKLIHDCEFENQQYVKLIEHEDTLLSNIEKEIEWKRGEIRRIETETPQSDAEIKQLHKQFVQNRDNLESQKKTAQILTDQITATTKKLEVLNMQRELENKEHQSTIQHYQDIASRYKEKYESLPLAIECKRAKEREEELKQQVQEKKNNINRLNRQMQILLCRREGKTMTKEDQEFIVKLAEARLANLKLVHDVNMKKQQLEGMKNQIEQNKSQTFYTAEKIEATGGGQQNSEPPRQTTDMDSAMISLYSSRDEANETMQETEDNPGQAEPQQLESIESRDPPQSWLSSFQKLQVQQRDPLQPDEAPAPVQKAPLKTTKSPVPPYVSYRRSDSSEDTVQVHLQRPNRTITENQQIQHNREQQERPGPANKRTLTIQMSPRIPLQMSTRPTHTAPSPEAVKQRLKVPKLELNTQFTRNIAQSFGNQPFQRQNQTICRQNVPRQALPFIQVPRKPTVSQYSKGPLQQPRQVQNSEHHVVVSQIQQHGVQNFVQQDHQQNQRQGLEIQRQRMSVAASLQSMSLSSSVSQQSQSTVQRLPSKIIQMPLNKTFNRELTTKDPTSSQSSFTQQTRHVSQTMSQPLMGSQFQLTSQPQTALQQCRELPQEPQTTNASPQKYAPTIQSQEMQNKRQEQDIQNHQSIQQDQTIEREQQLSNYALSPPREQYGSPNAHQEQDMMFKVPKYPAPKKGRSPQQVFQRTSPPSNSFQDSSVNSPPSALSYISPRLGQDLTDQDASSQASAHQQGFTDMGDQTKHQEHKEQEIRLKMLGPKEPYYLKLKSCPEEGELGEDGQNKIDRPDDSGSFYENYQSMKDLSISPGGAYHNNEESPNQTDSEMTDYGKQQEEAVNEANSLGTKSPGAKSHDDAFSPFNMKKHKEKLAELNKSPGAPIITASRRMFPSQTHEDKSSNGQVDITASGDAASMEKEPAFNFTGAFGGSKSPQKSDPPMMFGFGSGDSTENTPSSAFSLFGQPTGDTSPVSGFNFMGKSSEPTQQSGNFGIFGVSNPTAKEQDNSDYLSSLFGPSGGEEEEQSSGFSFSFEPSAVTSVQSPQQKSFSLF